MFGYIYITENVLNGKKYIGKRVGNFKPNYKGSGIKLKSAFKYYGKNNFTVSLLEECNDKLNLNDREIYWIKYYNAVESELFYNLSTGGNSWGSPKSEETREKIRQKALGRKAWNKGIPNPEQRKKMLENNPMKRLDVAKKCGETKRGLSSPNKGKKLNIIPYNKITDLVTLTCEECGKQRDVINKVHNHKRFCDKSCAASYSNKRRYLK